MVCDVLDYVFDYVVGSRLCSSGCSTRLGLLPWSRALHRAMWVQALRPHGNMGCSCRPHHICTAWPPSYGTVMSCQWTTTCPVCSTESFSSESASNTIFHSLAIQNVQAIVLDECVFMPEVRFGLEYKHMLLFSPALFCISFSLQVWILNAYRVEQSETTFAVYVEQIKQRQPFPWTIRCISKSWGCF